jgi:hypothetical protein
LKSCTMPAVFAAGMCVNMGPTSDIAASLVDSRA